MVNELDALRKRLVPCCPELFWSATDDCGDGDGRVGLTNQFCEASRRSRELVTDVHDDGARGLAGTVHGLSFPTAVERETHRRLAATFVRHR